MICDDCSTSFNPEIEGLISHGDKVIALCTSCCEVMEKETENHFSNKSMINKDLLLD